MTDNYQTFWIIESLDGKRVMERCNCFADRVQMTNIGDAADPIRLNTKRDCIYLVLSRGMEEANFNFKENRGAVGFR